MSAAATTTGPRVASIARASLAHLASVRVTGTLTEPGRLDTSMGREPAAFLQLHLQPPHGLPYSARLHLGTDVCDRIVAEAALPYLVRGALVSVAGTELELRTDHGHAHLRVVQARDLVIPTDPITPPFTPTAGGMTP